MISGDAPLAAQVARASFEQRLKAQALGLGFDLAGIATLGPVESSPAFERWLADGHHGEMDYLRRGAELREDTRRPEPGMTSALVVALDYGGKQPDGPVARYARGDDYHRVMWDKLDALLEWVRAERGGTTRGRAYVDTGPILERDLARRAGLGWFGKNTMLINPRMGSFFFIGALFLELDLVPDAPFAEEHCGTCTRCLDSCPTQAFVAPGMMDARRCISYLTIESRSAFPDEFAVVLAEHLYGCDVCQDVCPWNVRFAKAAPSDEGLVARAWIDGADVVTLANEILAMDEDAYRERFRGSAMKRAKLAGLQRNARAVVRAFRTASVAVSLLALAACTQEKSTGGGTNIPPNRPSLSPDYRASGHTVAGDVFVHLFEWTWPAIATECETVLGPAGYKAVQVSPPSEHSITPSRDWSERYQTVSYSLGRSRSGTQAQFIDMVNRCATVGVGIYVDAVINHMTNFPSPGVGSNGTTYTKYNYPGLYTATDFHSACALNNFSSAANVQDCELFSLPDLDTGSPSVRQKIADYMIALSRLGVAGFRVDAAKHIQQVELDDIFDRVNMTLAAELRPLPYVFLEISGGSGEALGEADFYGVGYGTGGATDITEFTVTGLADKFRKIGGQELAELDPNGPSGARFSEAAWGLMPSDKAVIFLQNHDTQHNCGIGPDDGDVYRLAHVFILAQPYGYPSVMSSYSFTCPGGNSTGPRSDPDGWTLPVSCITDWATAVDGDWICEHRDPYIRQMVGFRRVVAGTNINGWWDNDANAIAFSRGDRGFVAINRETISVTQTVATPLAPGTYCDRITGGKVGGACVGTTLTVAGDGTITFTLGANRALAIDTTTKL